MCCSDRVRAIAIAMGLQPVMWSRISATATFDTGGNNTYFPCIQYTHQGLDFYINAGITNVDEVLQNWENIIGNASTRSTGFIVLEHDLFQQTVEVATGYILPDAIAHQFTIKPVATCLNRTMSDAYIELNNNKTNPPLIAQSGVVTLTSTPSSLVQATGNSHNGSSASIKNIPGLALAAMTAVIGLVVGVAVVY